MKLSKKTLDAFAAESWELDTARSCEHVAFFSDMNGIDPAGLMFTSEAQAKSWLKNIAPIRRVQMLQNHGIRIGQEAWRR